MNFLKAYLKLIFLPFFSGVLFLTVLEFKSFSAWASAPSKTVIWEPLKNNLRLFGHFKPDKEYKSALDAEALARQQAIDELKSYLQTSVCQSGDGQPYYTLQEDWKKALRSQGSEIYPQGSLRITLVGKPFQILSVNPDIQPLANLSDVQFQLMGSSGVSSPCGVLTFVLEAGVQVSVIPKFQPVEEVVSSLSNVANSLTNTITNATHGSNNLEYPKTLEIITLRVNGKNQLEFIDDKQRMKFKEKVDFSTLKKGVYVLPLANL